MVLSCFSAKNSALWPKHPRGATLVNHVAIREQKNAGKGTFSGVVHADHV